MMTRCKALAFATLFIIPTQLFAQNVTDVVRYSNTQFQGTARFEAMGGSFGALGADLSSGIINPAGFGRFSNSQFSFSLNNSTLKTTSTFNANTSDYSKNVFKPTNLGIVFATDVSRKNKGFMFNQFGFTYNRVENYNNHYGYQGNSKSSLLDNFAANAYGIPEDRLDPFSSNLAYYTYAINPVGDGSYQADLTATDSVFQRRTLDTKGGISEFNFSYSFNYLNKLYVGMNVGIRTLNYREKYVHTESVYNPTLALDSFNYSYELVTKGNGNNLKIGMIYLATEQLRFGLALHTPTGFKLKDTWTANMESHFYGDTSIAFPYAAPIGDYKYRLRTPAKIIGSAAYVFGTRGCINVDLEYFNYAWGNIKNTKDRTYTPDPYNYGPQNAEIDDLLRSVVNLRIGGELVFNSRYFVRAGFGLYPQPYKIEDNKAMTTYSAGLGVKFGKCNLDLTYKLQNRINNYYAYSAVKSVLNSKIHGVVLTFAVNFN